MPISLKWRAVQRQMSPLSFHFAKMRLQAASASCSASYGLSAPDAAFANIMFSIHVVKISSIAAFA